MGPIAQCIQQISKEIGTALESFGFDPKPKIISGDSFIREWRRDNLWKFDVVEIYYKRGLLLGSKFGARLIFLFEKVMIKLIIYRTRL